jgi:hypothetical protein
MSAFGVFPTGDALFTKPAAAFSVTVGAVPLSGTAPLSVQFSATPNGGTNLIGYLWAFGDGTNSISQNPSHIYGQGGTFQAVLTATYANGLIAIGKLAIFVAGAPPPKPTGAFNPVLYLGGYSFIYSLTDVILNAGGTRATTIQIASGQDQVQPVGSNVDDITLAGNFRSVTDNSALTSIFTFTLAQEGYRKRPVVLGLFSQDSATPSGSQLWYCNVGYVQDQASFNYKKGEAMYWYPFKFSWKQANPLISIPTTTPITGGQQGYHFPTNSLASASGYYIVGVQFLGNNFGTGGLVQSITSVVSGDTGTIVGDGPPLGQPGNQLFGGQPFTVVAGQAFGFPPLIWPLREWGVNNAPNGNQSIAIAPGAISNTGYTANLQAPFASSFLPSNINLLLCKL